MIEHLKKISSKENILDRKKYYEIRIIKENLLSVIKFLKENNYLFFNQLIDITVIDNLSKELRFELVYILQSLKLNKKIIVKTFLREEDHVESITSIHNAANWYERECYDLFGIKFNNHPDLRRIMTDYNFEGHPLRKDFPLTGHTEVRYDNLEKKVVYESVKLNQEFRNFDYESPWEGLPNSLIGDEKTSKNESDE